MKPKMLFAFGVLSATLFAAGEGDLTNDVDTIIGSIGSWYHSDMVKLSFSRISEIPGMTKDRMSSLLVTQAMSRISSTNEIDCCIRRRILRALRDYGNEDSLVFLEQVLREGSRDDQLDTIGSYLKLCGNGGQDIRFFSSMTNFMTRIEPEIRQSIYLSCSRRLRTGLVSETNRVVLTAFLQGNVNHEEVGAGALDEALCLCDSTYATNAVRRSRLIRLIPSGRVCPLDLPRLRQELERLNTPQNP